METNAFFRPYVTQQNGNPGRPRIGPHRLGSAGLYCTRKFIFSRFVHLWFIFSIKTYSSPVPSRSYTQRANIRYSIVIIQPRRQALLLSPIPLLDVFTAYGRLMALDNCYTATSLVLFFGATWTCLIPPDFLQGWRDNRILLAQLHHIAHFVTAPIAPIIDGMLVPLSSMMTCM